MNRKRNSDKRAWKVFETPSKRLSKTVILALLLTILFHLLIGIFFPPLWENYLKKIKTAADELEIVFEPVFEEQRFVETNQNLKPEEPPPTNHFAAQSQVAAQEVPVEEDPSGIPALDGDRVDANKIVPGNTMDMDEIISYEQPVAMQSEQAVEDITNQDSKEGVSFVNEETARPSPRPRPTLKKSIIGPLVKNEKSAARVGVIAIDAQFSEFGEYLQRMNEVIGSQWQDLVLRQGIAWQNMGATVIIQFSLDFNGYVSGVKVLSSNGTAVLELLCKDAILARAPYGPWTKEMRMTLGTEKTITVGFIISNGR